MFQIAKNPTKNRALLSIALNDAEIEEMNELLVQAQELTGTLHTSIKDSYKQLLTTVISQCKQMIDTVKTEAANETDVVSTVQTADDTVKTEDFENALWERTKELTDEITVKTHEIETLKLDSTVKTNEIEALKSQLAIYEEMEIPDTVEIDKPFTPGENDVFIPLDDNHATILRTISQNRAKKLRLDQPQPISQIVKEIVFRKETLYNWGGGYWTGLK